ncbi:MAG: alpha/beta hydrolase [Ferrovibrio sp.]
MTAVPRNRSDDTRPVPTHPALMALMSHVPVQAFVGPRGTLVNMFTAGSGTPVLAVHASGMQGSVWRTLQTCMGDDFRFHCPDLYGYGRSEPLPMPQRMSLDDNAGLISTLLRRFSQPVHLLGHGFGAAVALRAALDNPGRLASLTLHEPLALHLLKPEYDGHAPAQRQIESLIGDMRAACLRGESHVAGALFYDFCCGTGAFHRLSQQRQAGLAAQAPRLCLDLAMTLRTEQPLAAYKSLNLPTLLLSGTRSPGAFRLVVERLAAAMPQARHAILPDHGHFAPTSQPESLARVVAPFMQACQQAALRACA